MTAELFCGGRMTVQKGRKSLLILIPHTYSLTFFRIICEDGMLFHDYKQKLV